MAFTIKNKKTQEAIFTGFCIAIIYSMLFLTYLNTVLSILLGVFWLLFTEKTFDLRSTKTKLMLLFTSLYLIGVAGMFYTDNIKAGLATLETQSAILFFPLIFGTISSLGPLFIKRITDHVLVATSVASVAGLGYGLYNFSQTGNSDLLTGDRILVFHAFRATSMGIFCLLSMIIALEKIKISSTNVRSLLYICIVLMSVMIFLLSIRLVMVCWLLIILFYSLKLLPAWRAKLFAITACVALLIISSLTIPRVKRQWNELFDFSSQSTIMLDRDSSLGRSWGGKAIRVAIWTCSFDIVKKHWVTGVGTGDVQDSLQKAYENRKFYFASIYNRYNAHNQYLQVLLATGLPGLAILLCCLLYPLWNYRKHFTGNIYLLFLLLFGIIGFTETVLEVNKGIIWYSFFNSIFAFGYLKSDKL
jgi:O-antigen ligase